MLKRTEMTLSAESCTGGYDRRKDALMYQELLRYFFRGMVTSNKAKRRCLDVSKSTLKKHGAVSGECGKKMARGGTAAERRISAFPLQESHTSGGGTKRKTCRNRLYGCSYKGCTRVRVPLPGNRARSERTDPIVAHGLAFFWCDCMMERADKKNKYIIGTLGVSPH